jgi:hypothetical protein
MIATQATPLIVADEKAGRRQSGSGRRQEGEGNWEQCCAGIGRIGNLRSLLYSSHPKVLKKNLNYQCVKRNSGETAAGICLAYVQAEAGETLLRQFGERRKR